MPSLRVARLRLIALWVSVTAHAFAVATVSTLALRELLRGEYVSYRTDVLASWLCVLAVPALLLSPLIGALAGSRWSRAVLTGSALVGAGVIALGMIGTNLPGLSLVGVLTLEAAFFGTTVVALIPAAATAAGWRAPGVHVGLAFGAAAGLLVGFELAHRVTPQMAAGYAMTMCLLTAAAAAFVAVPVAEPVLLARGLIQPLQAGVRDSFAHRRSRGALIGLWLWSFIALAVVFVIVRLGGDISPSEVNGPLETTGRANAVRDSILLVGFGVLGGILLGLVNLHPYRHAWLVPVAASASLVCFVWLRFGDAWETPLVVIGLAVGASSTGLLNAFKTWTAPRHHGVGAALVLAGACVAALVLAAVLPAPRVNGPTTRVPLLNVLIGVSAVAVVGAWWRFARPILEGVAEFPLTVLYRIRTFGPDANRLPVRGPCLVISNHAAWFDPLWLGKALPAPITPMMTSKFFDLPVISWLMRYVYDTIRVPEAPYRREAPELREAVSALDGGACVVLFPEGYLRRKEEQPLRRFGRGVWQILADRPATPVFACWIDGGWGSYFSYKDGPPTKNKRLDFWRPIRIGVVGPFVMDPALLADHMATRSFLMEQVNAARAPLGLEPLHLAAGHDGEKE